MANDPEFLTRFEVRKRDRRYQFWKRNSLSIELYSEKVFQQKLDYIHDNPVKAEMCVFPEDYYYSSARFYLQNKKEFEFLSHHNGG